jgi:plastocyanin
MATRTKFKTALSLAVLSFIASANAIAETYIVEAHNMTFVPDVITVQPGDVIRWEYVTGYPHDVTSGTKCSHDGYLFLDIPTSPGGSVEWIVPKEAPSEIPYFCELHCGGGMTGTINVESASEIGRMVIGIVDSSNCNFIFDESVSGMASMSFGYQACCATSTNVGGNFLLGVEVEEADVQVSISANLIGNAELEVFNASSGTTSPVSTGLMTLYAGQKYAFTGSVGAYNFTDDPEYFFEIAWPESDDGMEMNLHGIGGNSVSSSGDNSMFRASEYGMFTMEIVAEQDEFMRLAGIGNVSCSTLTIPTNGDEGEVLIPAGSHLIVIGGGNVDIPAEMGMLLMVDSNGDNGGPCLPEDVSGDGVVDVTDLLMIISAWGQTCP